MKTKATDEFPEIEWDRGDLEERHDHCIYYSCTGESADGRKYIGTWIEVDGEFSDIEKIEEGEY